MIYEIMTIVPSQFSDSEVDGVIAEIGKQMEAAGGTVKKSQNLGKLKIAYPIKHQRHGTYVLFYVEADTEKMMKLDLNLRLSDEVLRHLILACPAGIPEKEFKVTSYVQPITTEGRRAPEYDRARAEKLAEKAVSAEEAAAKAGELVEADVTENL
ncbi:30S ribosomal protein S6 [Patescibacteria group bacterium]|nr:30S ribosomal protein S6 [Patescibacteria group bacterium]